MTIYVKKLQKTTLNVFAGTVGESKRLEALEIEVAETEESKLAKAKEEAVGKLNEYLNPEEYSFNADAFKSAIAEGENAINEATTLEDVQSALDTAKANLDAIPNDEKALSNAKAEAEAKIDDYVGKLDTTKYADCMDEIVGLINESSNNLYNATTPEGATKVADDTIAAIESVKAEKDLKDAKAEAREQLDEYMSKLDTTNYTQRNLNKLMDAYNESSNKLFDATTPEEVKDVVDSTIKALESVLTNDQVEEAKQDVKNMLDEYMSTLDTVEYSKYNLLNEVISVINEASNKLHDAETVEAVEQASDEIFGQLKAIEAKKELVSVKEEAHKKLEDVYNSKSNTEYTVNRQKLLDIFNEEDKNIYEAENAEAVQDVLEQAIEKLNAVLSDKEQEELNKAKEEGTDSVRNTYSDILEAYDTEEANAILQELGPVIEEVANAIKEATTPEEVAKAVESANAKMKEIQELWNAKKEGTATLQSTYDGIKSASEIKDKDNENTPLQKSLKDKIDLVKNDAEDAIEKATTPEEVESVVTSVKTKMQEAKDVFDMQKAGSDEIQTYWWNLQQKYPCKLQEFGQIIANATDKLKDITIKEEVEKTVENAKNEMDKIVLPIIKNNSKQNISDEINNQKENVNKGSSKFNKDYANSKLEEIKTKYEKVIENAKDEKETLEKLNEAKQEIQNVIELFNIKEKTSIELQTYWNDLQKQHPEATIALMPLFVEGLQNIGSAKDEAEVQQASEQAKIKMSAVAIPE